MRVFLILLLFTLLPLQSPAAATVTCGYGQVAEGLQNKHHQPVHGLAIVGAASSDDCVVSSSSFHLDCGTCHANCAAAMFTVAATFANPAGIERIEHIDEARFPPWHARPYRPQWHTPIRSGFSTAA